jgi:predicted N-acyltransferase
MDSNQLHLKAHSEASSIEDDTCKDVVQYKLKIFESISKIEKNNWDKIVGLSGITRSHDYLRAIESSKIQGCDYFYPVVYDHLGNIVGHACVYTVITDFGQLMPKILFYFVKKIRKIWPSLLSLRITECATPLVSGCSISNKEGVCRRQIILYIEAAMKEIALKGNSKLLVLRDFLEGERELFTVLESRGYEMRSNFPLARIEVRWNTYDAYLNSFRARYRKDIKRRLRQAELSGHSVEVMQTFACDATLWARQAGIIRSDTRGFMREALTPEYYENMDIILGDDSLLVTVNSEGRRIAHGMVIFDEETTFATFFGRDKGSPGGEWFQLLNEVVRIAIERKSKFLHLGLGSYDGKSIIGADVEPLYVYRKSTNALLNFLINRVPDLMKIDQLPPRRLFREHTDSSTSKVSIERERVSA